MSPSEKVWCANAPNAILTRLRAKVGPARFRDLMLDLPDALDEIRGRDVGGVAEFHQLPSGDDFRAFLAEITDVIDNGSDPCAFWAEWIDVVVERTPVGYR